MGFELSKGLLQTDLKYPPINKTRFPERFYPVEVLHFCNFELAGTGGIPLNSVQLILLA